MFQKEMNRHYQNGYNVIFGSEEIDVTLITKRNYLLDEILSIVPQAVLAQNNLSVFIICRSPRVKHLISLCKHVNQELLGKYEHGSFSIHSIFTSAYTP